MRTTHQVVLENGAHGPRAKSRSSGQIKAEGRRGPSPCSVGGRCTSGRRALFPVGHRDLRKVSLPRPGSALGSGSLPRPLSCGLAMPALAKQAKCPAPQPGEHHLCPLAPVPFLPSLPSSSLRAVAAWRVPALCCSGCMPWPALFSPTSNCKPSALRVAPVCPPLKASPQFRGSGPRQEAAEARAWRGGARAGPVHCGPGWRLA